MYNIRVIQIKQSLFADNDVDAERLRGQLKEEKTFLLNLMSSPGSGKTTTAMRLQEYLQNLGVHVCLLSMDNFFLPLDERPPEASDWESPLCVNRDLLIDCIHRLSDGEEVELPIYDFKSGTTGSWFSGNDVVTTPSTNSAASTYARYFTLIGMMKNSSTCISG